MINHIWKESVIPQKYDFIIQENVLDERFTDMRNLQKINSYKTIMEYDIDSLSYLFIPESSNNKLVVYHQGHGGDFLLGFSTIQKLSIIL